VQATGDAGTLEGLLSGVLFSGGNETGHLMLGELNLAATESGQAEVGNLELLGGSTHVDGMDMERVGGELRKGRMGRVGCELRKGRMERRRRRGSDEGGNRRSDEGRRQSAQVFTYNKSSSNKPTRKSGSTRRAPPSSHNLIHLCLFLQLPLFHRLRSIC
jgi:hypothetical protein